MVTDYGEQPEGAPVLRPAAVGAVVAGSVVVALGALCRHLFVDGAQKVDDLIGSWTTVHVIDKSAEVAVFAAVGMVAVIVAPLVAWRAFRRDRTLRQARHLPPVGTSTALGGVVIVALWAIAGQDAGEAVAIVVAGGSAIVALRYLTTSSAPAPGWPVPMTLCLLIGLLAVVDVLALGTASAALWPNSSVQLPWVPLPVLVCSVFLGAVGAAAWSRGRPPGALLGLARWAQVPLPLLLVAVFRTAQSTDQGTVRGSLTFGFVVAVAVAAAATAWNMRAALRVTGPPLTFPAVCAVAVLVNAYVPEIVGFPSTDDFHVGEQLIQSQQLRSFGHAAFESFVPVPGLIGALTGTVNSVLFGGDLAGWPLSVLAVRLVAVLLGVTAMTFLIGRWWTLALVLVPVLPYDRMYFIVPFLIALAVPGLVRAPHRWLFVWVVGVSANVLLVSANGLVVALATAPVMVWQVARLLARMPSRADAKQVVPWIVASGAVVVVAAPYVVRVVRHAIVASGTNDVTYGVPLLLDYGVTSRLTWLPGLPRGALWELFRSSGWLLGAPLLVALAMVTLLQWRKRWSREAAPVLVLAVGSTLFLLLSIPYAYGRVDPALSRSGAISLSAMATLVPVALLLSHDVRRGQAALAVLAFAATTWTIVEPTTPRLFLERMLRGAPLSGPVVAGESTAAPDVVGEMMVTDQVAGGIAEMRAITDAVLEPGETYYDMANRSVYYFILSRRTPTRYPSVYYAAATEVQRDVLEAFDREPPPLVWIDPAMAHDNVPASLRAYRVYRWLLLNGYQYRASGTFKFLVRPDRAPRLPQPPGNAADALAQTFKPSLEFAPVTWGENLSRIRPRLHEWAELESSVPRSTGPGEWAVDLGLPSGPGPSGDIVVVHATCGRGGRVEGTGELRWLDPSTRESRVMTFFADGVTFVIPAGAHPAWFLSGPPDRLELVFGTRGGCADFAVSGPALARLGD